MPRGSFAPSEAYEMKLGWQEGFFEIIDASAQVFQYPPNKESGEQSAAFLALVLSMQKTDKDGNPTDDDPVEEVLKIEKDLSKARPGHATGREDEPEDLGDELGTKGNCIYTEEGFRFNNKSKFMIFTKSLAEQGFKEDVLHFGWTPDLIGVKGHAKKVAGPKIPGSTSERDPMYLVVDKLSVRPYEQTTGKGKGKGSAAKPAASASSSSSPAPAATSTAAAPAAQSNGISNGNGELDEKAEAILMEIAGENSGQSIPRRRLNTMVLGRVVANVDKPHQEAVKTLLKSDTWLGERAADLKFKVDADTITFS